MATSSRDPKYGERDPDGAQLPSRSDARRLIVATVCSLAVIVFYGRNDLTPEDYALRTDDFHAFEEQDGVRFTGSSVREILGVVDRLPKQANPILWLGNSQLHTINQAAAADHLAPYWLRQGLGTLAIPIGASLPNANIQEHYVLARYALCRRAPSLIIIELVFDDLREDGLRGDFRHIVDSPLSSCIAQSNTARSIVSRLESTGEENNANGGTSGVLGFGQRQLEETVVASLSSVFPPWAKRPSLRARLMIDLYETRNWVFGIKSTSVRRVIPARYDRNMQALGELLDDAKAAHIPVIAYIAPLRPDVSPPYDIGQYGQWKVVAAEMVQSKGGRILNLESLVPAEKWGTYHGDDVDFMHFQGEGHRLLAQALQPEVVKTLAN